MRPIYFIIAIFIIIIIVIAFLFAFFRGGKEEKAGFSSFPAGEIKEREGQSSPAISVEEIKEQGKTKEELPIYALIQITDEPISGFKPLKNSRARFIEKSTGHIFEADLSTGEKKLISNTTLPKIFESAWNEKGDKILLKYLEDEQVRVVSSQIVGSSTQGVILPQDAQSFGYLPGSDNIFYFIPTGRDKESGTVIRANFENQSQREIYSSPYLDFIVSWPKSNILSLATRPSGLASGFLYQYNPLTGSFKKILGDILGMEVKWAENGKSLVVSSYSQINSAPVLRFYDLEKEEFLNANFTGLAQKCAFSKIDDDLVYCALSKNPPPALYPDEWHQGLVSLNDEFWQINLKTGETKLIYNEQFFDVWRVEPDDNDEFLYFQDRSQEFLWALKIK